MKKWIATTVVLAAMVTASYATTLSRQTREIQFSGSADVDSVHGSEIDLTTGYGFFIEDNREFGGRFRILLNEDVTLASIGPFYEWSFERGSRLVPFTGLHAGITTADVEVDGGELDTTALIFGASMGARYFVLEDLALARHMAISGALIVEYATDKVYLDGRDPKNVDFRAEAGLRFFF